MMADLAFLSAMLDILKAAILVGGASAVGILLIIVVAVIRSMRDYYRQQRGPSSQA